MNTISRPVDITKVHTVVYHMPDGQSFVVEVDDIDEFHGFGLGDVCDTSEIDGRIHFYPKGHA